MRQSRGPSKWAPLWWTEMPPSDRFIQSSTLPLFQCIGHKSDTYRLTPQFWLTTSKIVLSYITVRLRCFFDSLCVGEWKIGPVNLTFLVRLLLCLSPLPGPIFSSCPKLDLPRGGSQSVTQWDSSSPAI